MAVVKRATSPTGRFHSLGSRLPTNLYNDLAEWAYGHRVTVSAAVAVLLEKAMNAERSGEYIPYSDTEQNRNIESS